MSIEEATSKLKELEDGLRAAKKNFYAWKDTVEDLHRELAKAEYEMAKAGNHAAHVQLNMEETLEYIRLEAARRAEEFLQ